MIQFSNYPDKAIQRVINALNAQKSPDKIWQQPYEHDGKAYGRLCKLDGAEPSGIDLCEYAMDLSYEQSPIQPDLFKYLLPICLWAWKRILFGQAPREYGAFEEHFFPALIKQRAVYTILNHDEFESVEDFVIECLLDRIVQETRLCHNGSSTHNPVYAWFYALSAFSMVFPGIPKLWPNWWTMSHDGHAIAALQYISCLMYDEQDNPIFPPWTPTEGGGAPWLSETGCHFYEGGWRPENIEFLKSTLSVSYVEHGLQTAAKKLMQSPVHSEICSKLLNDWKEQHYRAECRIEQLPEVLSNVKVTEWPVR